MSVEILEPTAASVALCPGCCWSTDAVEFKCAETEPEPAVVEGDRWFNSALTHHANARANAKWVDNILVETDCLLGGLRGETAVTSPQSERVNK